MDPKEQYTVDEQQNSKPSAQDGQSDTSATKQDAKNDAMAVFISALADVVKAGWVVERRFDNLNNKAYIVFPDAVWEMRGAAGVIVEVK